MTVIKLNGLNLASQLAGAKDAASRAAASAATAAAAALTAAAQAAAAAAPALRAEIADDLTAAQEARDGAELAEQNAVDISGITIDDDIVEVLVKPGVAGPKTKAALASEYPKKAYSNTETSAASATTVPGNRELVVINPGSGSGMPGAVLVGDGVTQVKDMVDPTKRNLNRARQQHRRDNPSRPVRVALPTSGGLGGVGFGWQSAPINIFRAGTKYVTDFDVAKFKNTGATTIYVNTTSGGNNANPGTDEALPKATMGSALAAVPAGGTIVVLDPAGTIIHRTAGGLNTVTIDKSVNIIARNDGIRFSYSDAAMVWSPTATPGVYTATRSNVSTVVEASPFGDFGYTRKTTLADVQAARGNWTEDATTVTVHTLDGQAPGSRLLVLLSGEAVKIKPATADVAVYLENIGLTGSSAALIVDGTVGYHADLYAKDCEFTWTTGGTYDTVCLRGSRYSFFQSCRVAYGAKDGLNYASTNTAGTTVDAPRYIEVNCVSHSHGIPFEAGLPNNPQTNNCTTGHSGAQGIRIGGEYYDSTGTAVADVHVDTMSVNYSCVARDSALSDDSSYDANWSAQQAGTSMWLFDCVGYGSRWDVVASTGAQMVLDGCELDSVTGTAQITRTNAA